MSKKDNVLCLFNNLADLSSTQLSASSEVVGMPIGNVNNINRHIPWRSTTNNNQNIDIVLSDNDFEPKLLSTVVTANDLASNEDFGNAVSISANGLVMAVGVRLKTLTASFQGAVEIFDLVNKEWVFRELIISTNPINNEYFGTAVTLNYNGSYIYVGATGYSATFNKQGAIFVFSGISNFTFNEVIISNNAHINERFGSSVSVQGSPTVLAVGSDKYTQSLIPQGAVQIFDRFGNAWNFRFLVLAADAAANNLFGRSVTLNGDATMLIVGAPWNGKGKIYFYTLAAGFTETITILGPTSNYFGWDLTINEDANILIVTISSKRRDFVVYRLNASSQWVIQSIIATSSLAFEFDGNVSCDLHNNTNLVVGSKSVNSDLGAVLFYDVKAKYSHIALIEHNLSNAASINVTGWYDAINGVTPIFDINVIANKSTIGLLNPSNNSSANINPIAPPFIIDLNGLFDAGFIRITISDPKAQYIEIGRLFIANAWQANENMSWNWNIAYQDNSQWDSLSNGQKIGNINPNSTNVNFALDWNDEFSRDDLYNNLSKVGAHNPVVLQMRPKGNNDGVYMSYYGTFESWTLTPNMPLNTSFKLQFKEAL